MEGNSGGVEVGRGEYHRHGVLTCLSEADWSICFCTSVVDDFFYCS